MNTKKYIVFDIGGTFVKYAVVDSSFKIIMKDKFPFEAMKRDCKKEMIPLIGKTITDLEKKYGKVDGIGISTAGDIDPNTTLVIGACPNHNNYAGTIFKDVLKPYTSAPLVVENDANIAALGESVNGDLKGIKDAVMITLGTGIGCGIIIDGKIFKGPSGCGANVGYLNILGKKWENYFSAIGLTRLLKEMKGVEIKEPIDILLNKEYADVVDYWYEGLAAGIANLILILSPTKFVIGGGIVESKKVDLDIIKSKVKRILVEDHFYKACDIQISNYGNESALFGCVELLNKKLGLN